MAVAKTMTAEHKEALARGRTAARAVKAYLNALEDHRPKRGRRRTPESIRARLEAIDAGIGDASVMERLAMAQDRIDLSAELARLESDPAADLAELESTFVAQAKAYGEAKGISYAAWREIGVAPTVLAAAGIRRSG